MPYKVRTLGHQFDFIDVEGDGNCFYHALLKSTQIYDLFQSQGTLRTYLAQQVQSNYHQDPFLKHVFVSYACGTFSVEQWSHDIQYTRLWGSMLEAVLITYFLHIRIFILSNDFNGDDAHNNTEQYLHAIYSRWEDHPINQDLNLPIVSTIYIFHHTLNQPLNRHTRRNHFAYLDPVPIERHIEMNDNTIITVVPTATPIKISTSSHS